MGHVASMGVSRGAYRVLVGKTEGKRRDHVEDSGIDGRTILKSSESGIRGMDWIDVAQDRDTWRAFVNAVMNLRFP